MAFAASGLRKLAEGLFSYYAAADTAATVQASGYFNSATKFLKQDDVIIVIGAARTTIDMAVVNSASGAATVTTIGAEGVTGT
jgi:hypothetical protein